MQQLQSNAILQSGKYKIIKVLGQGGFGITYMAEQPMLHRKVSIKEFFMKDLCDRDEGTSMVSVPSTGSTELVGKFKDKFIREASIIASLNHHNIVPIHDIFEENGTAYYVMEYIDGGSLYDKVKQDVLPEAEALKYIREVANALSFVHKQNILHLDVKPANILLRNNGEAVLIDFGISKHYDEEGGQTSTTPVGISKGYAPMEQYNQGLKKFSPATDIYSLGATLYKLITGNTPPEASLLLNDEEDLERPDNVSFSTWTAIEKAMEPKIKRRPQSVEEFLSIMGGPQVTMPASVPQQIVKHIQEETIVETKDVNDVTIVDESSKTIEPVKTMEPIEPVKTVEPVEFEVNGIKFRMIKVEGGTFEMEEEVTCGFMGLSTKQVRQRTTLSDYWIGETVVTQALWKAIFDKNPSKFIGDDNPVENVTWNNCISFIKNINSLTNKEFRLPTEAEWEFAARGGNKSHNCIYSGSDDYNEVAWSRDNSNESTHKVASKKPNELGIYDMSGNVWEWCNDWYDKYMDESIKNPKGPRKGKLKVNRGGSYRSIASHLKYIYRESDTPEIVDSYHGFRLAITNI